MMTGGRGFGLRDRLSGEHGYARMKKLGAIEATAATQRVVPMGS